MSEVVAGEIFSRSVNTAGILCSQGNSLYCNTIAIYIYIYIYIYILTISSVNHAIFHVFWILFIVHDFDGDIFKYNLWL